jgi:hypothetical protein
MQSNKHLDSDFLFVTAYSIIHEYQRSGYYITAFIFRVEVSTSCIILRYRNASVDNLD